MSPEAARNEVETGWLDLEGIGRPVGIEADALLPGSAFEAGGVTVHLGRAEDHYASWPTPIAIISDGPYGVGGFPGDPNDARALPEWYRPHVAAWSAMATPETTLWFWNTELGWANVHPILEEYGWEYRTCHVWNKGIAHIAGNANSQTLRKLPVVTEVCVQYVKPARFEVEGEPASMQDWLRHEWQRSGLPFYRSNEACGVRNAASRKYLAPDHVWYYPPPEMFERLAAFANKHGDPSGRPYFSIDGRRPVSRSEWARMRAKFHCPIGVTNVWDHPPVNGVARIREGLKALHYNQKPLKLIRRTIELSTDEGDVVWEPFGGLCTGAVASLDLGRRCVSAEIIPEYYLAGCTPARIKPVKRTTRIRGRNRVVG